MSDPAPDLVAENSRLKALVLRSAPVINAALELRRMGLAHEAYHAQYEERRANGHMLSRSYTVAMMMEQAYETALKAFDAAVRKAALTEFEEFRLPPEDGSQGASDTREGSLLPTEPKPDREPAGGGE